MVDAVTVGPYDTGMSTLRTMSKEKMKAIRDGLGLSLTQMAMRFNVARRTYVRWEAGDRKIDGPAVIVADLLEKELTELRSTSKNS
jgi:DNA-binding transcriptional regulator YiaG